MEVRKGLSVSQKIVLDKFAKQFIAQAKLDIRTKKVSNYRKSPVNASGELDRSFEYRITDTGMEILANDYVYYLLYGRKPGRKPPFQAIRDWIDQKGIVPNEGNTSANMDSLAWAIVKSIANKGTSIYQTFAGSNSGLLDESFDPEALKQLEKELTEATLVRFESEVFQELKEFA